MSLIRLTIDNKTISVSPGTTILEAAKSAGIYIPTLCSHPDLPPTALEISMATIFQGNLEIQNTMPGKAAKRCGLCLVEIEGEKELISSCVARVKKGIIVNTNNEQIKIMRRKNLIPILSRHKHACLTCAQQDGCSQTQCSSNVSEEERCCSRFGNCELRGIVNYIGIPQNTSKWIPSDFPILKDNPLFEIDYNLCIGCTRCVRACNKLRGVKALGFVWTNQNFLQVGTVMQSFTKSECKFCTTCVEVCPTGALSDNFVKTGKKEADIVPCKAACPVNINVPEYVRMISLNKFEDAIDIIRKKVPFPAVLGRICMHPCEKVCRRNKINSAISICALKRFASDMDRNSNSSKKTIETSLKTGKKIAIIGAGPAGLTASFYLRKKGHDVTLYDEKSKAGGTLRFGIPSYRLPSKILDDEIETILSTGINFIPNKRFGKDFDFDSLLENGFKSILITVGRQSDLKIPIKGHNLKGVMGGAAFLRNINDNVIKIGENIVVVGGGNAAIDVAMTAIRFGAREVSIVCLETENEMPATDWELRTAKSEGIKILPSWAPEKIIGKNGHVVGIEVVKCKSVFDSDGIFNPQCDFKTRKIINADQVFLAIGQKADLKFIDLTNISTKNGLISVNTALETSFPNIYAAGDITSLQGSVISSIATGRKAAESIDKALGGTGSIDDNELLTGKSIYEDHIGRHEGFSKRPREKESELEIIKRIDNFEEIILGFTKEQAISEAERCLQCDLRLKLQSNTLPPKSLLLLTAENIIKTIPKTSEGVYKLFDENENTIAIVGTAKPHEELFKVIENKNNTITFFEFEKDKMYSKRESELIQKHLQEYGEMPGGSDDELDDLF